MRDLAALQSLPLDNKVVWSLCRIQEALDYCDRHGLTPLLSYSGGKDSELLKRLVHMVRPSVLCVFVNTGLEFPEVVAHARLTPGLVELQPAMSFKAVLERYGYPVISKKVARNVSRIRNTKSLEQICLRMEGGVNPSSGKVQHQSLADKWKYLLNAPFKISDECCAVMKKKPLKAYHKKVNGFPFVGTLAADSDTRKTKWRQHGCNAFDLTHPDSAPLSIWTEQDVLEYLHQNSIPISPVYGEIARGSDGLLHTTGEDRTGCVFCLFGIAAEQKKRGCNRFQRMAVTHPQLHSYCMDKLGIRAVMNYIGLPTEAVDAGRGV